MLTPLLEASRLMVYSFYSPEAGGSLREKQVVPPFLDATPAWIGENRATGNRREIVPIFPSAMAAHRITC
jgi:hypothetical protein